MKNTNTDGTRQALRLRCHGCGAVHPEVRTAAPDERTICPDCEERAEVDPAFDLLISLAVKTDVPLYVAMASATPTAPGVH